MGKRSDFKRLPKDKYYTWDKKAYPPLMDHIPKGATFAEPCCGEGHMVRALESEGLRCEWQSDIEGGETPKDALRLSGEDIHTCQYIITNPPWSRHLLHPMIEHFTDLKPTWLLFDAGWMFTKQAVPFLVACRKIVSVGRLKWIPDSEHSAKDDCCWYLFDKNYFGKPQFYNER